jgi:hypothetical protein
MLGFDLCLMKYLLKKLIVYHSVLSSHLSIVNWLCAWSSLMYDALYIL